MSHDHEHDHEHEHEGLPAEEITPDFPPGLRSSVGVAILDDEAVLLDEHSGTTHLLNASGTLVLRCYDGRSSIADIAADIADEFGVERGIVEADVVTLTRDLGARGLLEGVRRAAAPANRPPAGIPVGTRLSSFEASTASGDAVDADSLRANKWTVLVNWSPRCGYCTRIVGQLAEAAAAMASVGGSLLLVTTASPEDTDSHLQENGGGVLTAVHVVSVPDFFEGIGTPAAYLVTDDAVVAEPLALGAEQVPALVDRLAGPATLSD